MFREISEKIDSFLQKSELSQYVVRRWEYRNIAYVVDFDFRNVKFGFDVYPLINGHFFVEMVERPHNADIVLLSAINKKQLLVRNASVSEVVDKIGDRANQLIAKINTYRSNPSSLSLTISEIENRPPVSPSTKGLRVGVMTLPLNKNIGGNLQAYAMMEVLKRLGHSPVFINSKHPPSDASLLPPVGPADLSQPLLTNSVKIPARFPNGKFTDKYLAPITVPFNSKELLIRDIGRLGLDAIIAGSDQIWRPKYSKALLACYFFDFLPPDSKIKRISYAASFGTSDWEFDEEQTREASRLVKQFDAVGVREDEAVRLCAKYLNVQAQHVLDPTILLDRSAYASIIAEAKQGPSAGQVVTYVLDITRDKVAVVQELAKTLALDAFSTTGRSFSLKGDAEDDMTGKSVQQWLASLERAAFIVTDSFHGVAFSILFNKPFIAYGNPQRGMSRFTSLLKVVGLEDRLVTQSSDVDVNKMVQPIDWRLVNDKLVKLRAQSFDFLVRALSGKN